MRALVVYESLWGNTEKIARVVADRLAGIGTVVVVDSDAAPDSADGYDLVVVGGPTHAFSMTRAATRAEAVNSHSAPHRPDRGIREWLNELDSLASAIPAVAFDTRVDKSRLPGSAATSARHELRSLGFDTSLKQETFRVVGYEGPLLDGELERARAWADEFIAALGLAGPVDALARQRVGRLRAAVAETVPSAVAYRLSAALGVVALAAASTSFFIAEVLGGPAVAQGNLRGTALVIMVLAVPVLFTSMHFAWKNSARALVVWLGAVAYIIYQAVLFLFGSPFNSLFLIYVAMLSLGFWSAVVLMRQIDLAAFSARFDGRLPARGIAIYAVILAALNALVWLRTIVPAVLSDSPSAFLEGSGVTTSPVFVQDLALWLPLLVMGSWWLWKGRPLGQLVVGAMLVLLLLESIGVATDQWFGAMADPNTPFASMTAVPLFLALAIVGAVPFFFYVRHLDAPGGSAPKSAREA